MNGIDVSRYDGVIDWPNIQPGLSFVWIKATDGLGPDAMYAKNIPGARASSIPLVGSYHFFQPDDDPQKQCDNFVATANIPSGDLRPMVDAESQKHRALTPADADTLGTLLGLLQAKLGYYPVLYTSPGSWAAMNNPSSGGGFQFANCPLWIARYTSDPDPGTPAPWATWRIWQYSETGSVAGITGDVDLDRSLDDLSDIVVP